MPKRIFKNKISRLYQYQKALGKSVRRGLSLLKPTVRVAMLMQKNSSSSGVLDALLLLQKTR